jgi:hypothetical protein
LLSGLTNEKSQNFVKFNLKLKDAKNSPIHTLNRRYQGNFWKPKLKKYSDKKIIGTYDSFTNCYISPLDIELLTNKNFCCEFLIK